MCNPIEPEVIKSRKQLLEEANEKMLVLKKSLDLQLASMNRDELEAHEIEIQLQACMNEFFQCSEMLLQDKHSWAEIPLKQQSV